MKKRSKIKRNIIIVMWLLGAFGAGLGCIPIMLCGVVGFVIAFVEYDAIDWGEDEDDD